MHAYLNDIELIDFDSWEDLVSKTTDPYESGIWLTLYIGDEYHKDTTARFDVLVCTHAAKREYLDDNGNFRGILVDCIDPDMIKEVVRKRIEAIKGRQWFDIVDQLRGFTHWEYEGR